MNIFITNMTIPSTLMMLLDASLRCVLLFALAGAVSLLLRNRSAALRHGVWTTAVVLALLLPVLSAVLPSWRLGVLPDVVAVTTSSEPVSEPTAELSNQDPAPQAATPTFGWRGSVPPPSDMQDLAGQSPARQIAQEESTPAVTGEAAVEAAPTRETTSLASSLRDVSVSTWILLIWAVGVVVMFLSMLTGTIAIRRVARKSSHITDSSILAMKDRLCEELAIHQPVLMLQSDESFVPVTWGVWWPAVLLPREAKDWTSSRLRMVLLHELAHVKRGDCMTQLLVQLARAMYWFHPLVWWASRNLRIQRERACDDLVLSAGVAGPDYADQLLQIVRSLRSGKGTPLAAVAMARKSQFESRLLSVLDTARRRSGLSRKVAWAILVVALTVAIPLAALQPVARAKDTADQPDISKKVKDTQLLSYVHDESTGRESIGGSGHAVKFTRNDGSNQVVQVKIYGSRYGYPQPPKEDVKLYLLDEDQNVIKEFPFPYSTFKRGGMKWYTLRIKPTVVPETFYVALSFNPTRTKGVYMGMDDKIKDSPSYIGLPDQGYEPWSRGAWMIRAVLRGKGTAEKDEKISKDEMVGWVENFFSRNYRDITARKTLEWGQPEKTAEGNYSIRYKCLVTIRHKNKMIIESRFIFTPEGKYVSTETIEKKPVEKDVKEEEKTPLGRMNQAAFKTVFVPKIETKKAKVILDLATGKMLRLPKLSDDNQLPKYFMDWGMGDVGFSEGLLLLRGASLYRLSSKGEKKVNPSETQDGSSFYPLPEIPVRMMVKAADGNKFIIHVLSKKNGGINIKYGLIESDQTVSPSQPSKMEQPRSDNSTEKNPVVVKTMPAAFANDVDPKLSKITVTFDRPMMNGSWSWTGGGDTYPKGTGRPSYDAKRTTCTLPVKLQPGKVYWVGINSPSHKNFKTTDRKPARWYVILFATKSAGGKPTPIPADLIKKAKYINGTSQSPAKLLGGGLAIPPTVVYHVTGAYLPVAMPYWQRNQYASAQIYLVTDQNRLVFGGLMPVYNPTSEPWTGKRCLTSSSYNDLLIFDTKNLTGPGPACQWVENETKGGGRYALMWTPKYPLNPGDSQLFVMQRPVAEPLPKSKGGDVQIRMQNHLGATGVEQFFLVVPAGREVKNASRKWTSKSSVKGYDIYCFQTEVTPETDNVVTAAISKTAGQASSVSDADKRKAENVSAQGWKLWQQRKLSEAEELFQKAVKLDPANTNAWNGLGWSQFNQGKPMNAEEAFQRCIALEPKHAAALNGLGWIAKGQKKTKEAIVYWTKAVEAAPTATAALNGLTQTYMEQKKYADAIQYYEMWLKAEPNNTDAKRGLEKARKAAKASPKGSAEAAAIKAAMKAAEQWLKVINAGEYAKAWESASPGLQKLVTQDDWIKVMKAVQSGFAVKSRTLESQQKIDSMPGLPGGPFVVLRYDAQLESKHIWENVVLRQEGADKWQVIGFTIAPKDSKESQKKPKDVSDKAVKSATKAAERWLRVIDAGEYAKSWEEMAAMARSVVTKEQWVKDAGVLKEFGPVKSRKLLSADYSTTIPGAPDGQYVVLTYKTVFENKKAAVETVTPMKDKDGTWRVSGYWVK